MVSAELLTGLGAAASIFFASTGAALASAPSGVFALRSTTYRAFAPIVISGVLAIYGIIIAVILAGHLNTNSNAATTMTEADGYKHLASGLTVGLACLASGLGMARFLESHMALPAAATGHRGGEQEQPLVVGGATRSIALNFPPPSLSFMCVLTFLEAIGLYGLIVALVLESA